MLVKVESTSHGVIEVFYVVGPAYRMVVDLYWGICKVWVWPKMMHDFGIMFEGPRCCNESQYSAMMLYYDDDVV